MQDNLTKQMIVGFPFVFESETSVGNMVQIFEPLEEGNRHTAGVDIQIWYYENIPVNQDFVRCRSRRSVCRFGDDFGLFRMVACIVK